MNARGFTLVELVVAMTVAALVVLLAQRLFGAVLDGSHRVAIADAELTRTANARRWFVEAFGSLDVSDEGSGGFAGRQDRVEFATWLLTTGNWFEHRRVILRVDQTALVAEVGSDSIVLVDSVTGVRFDYLLDPGAAAVWVQEWLSPARAPLAVRMRILRGDRADTLLFPVGPRG